MNNKTLLFLFLILIVACNTEAEKTLLEPSAEKQLNAAVVIINNSTDSPISIELLDSIAHRPDNWIVNYKSADTIALKLNQPARATVHSLVQYRQTKFISNGDTLRIDLNSNEMQVQSTDRLDVQNIVEERGDFLSKTDSLFNLLISVDSSFAVKGVSYDLSLTKNYGISVNKLLLERNPEVYDQLVQKLFYQLEATPSLLAEVNDSELEAIQNLKNEINRKEALTRLGFLARQFDQPEIYDNIFKSDLYQTDIFVKSPFVRGYLSYLIIKLVLKGEQDRSGNHVYVDYKLAYNKLPEYLEDDLLAYARKICLEQMVSYDESSINVREYLSKFLADHQDSAFVASFEERYLLAYDEQINDTADLLLTSNSGSALTLSELVKEVSDSTQLYYVDFWASWCAPCRQAMPFSEEKRALFEDKGVKFIYLSMDRDKQKWETASLSHHLETYEHSYLLINPEAQQFIKDLKIDFIPRYIILNSEGKVIEDNAPGPEGERLDEVLRDYLGS